METIRVGYSKPMTIVFGVLAAVNIVLGLMVGGTSLFIGGLMVVLAVLYAINPYFEVVAGTIHVKNLFGMVVKRIEFDDYSALTVSEDGKRFQRDANDGGPLKRVPLTHWVADKQDWQRFVDAVRTAEAFD